MVPGRERIIAQERTAEFLDVLPCLFLASAERLVTNAKLYRDLRVGHADIKPTRPIGRCLLALGF
jgi:hypothetical protein